jgi:hypothetical protein
MSNHGDAVAPIQAQTFITREAATQLIVDSGVPIGRTALANMASDGKGPPYCVINGRTLYRRHEVLGWLAEEAARPPRRRGGGERTAAGAP